MIGRALMLLSIVAQAISMGMLFVLPDGEAWRDPRYRFCRELAFFLLVVSTIFD